MQLLAPDILEEARGLSAGVNAAGVAVGVLLWLFGWQGHRFWIVLVTTVGAGILGLYSGPAYGSHPLVAGLLLAVAAGCMALALVRVVAFAAGGVAGWMLLRTLAPAVNEPLLAFLSGGLVGLLLFRVWTMILTSSGGTVLLAYSGLALADRSGNLDAVRVAENQAGLLAAVCGGVALFGVLVQYLLDRSREHSRRRREGRSRGSGYGYNNRGWLGWGHNTRGYYRRAG